MLLACLLCQKQLCSLRFESSGISCITNYAAGFQEELNHEEVVATERVKGNFKGLLKAILAEL